jgi:hypothetical protein
VRARYWSQTRTPSYHLDQVFTMLCAAVATAQISTHDSRAPIRLSTITIGAMGIFPCTNGWLADLPARVHSIWLLGSASCTPSQRRYREGAVAASGAIFQTHKTKSVSGDYPFCRASAMVNHIFSTAKAYSVAQMIRLTL